MGGGGGSFQSGGSGGGDLLAASLCQSRLEAGPTCFSLPPRERQAAAATNLPFVFLNICIAIISLSAGAAEEKVVTMVIATVETCPLQNIL